MYRIIPCVRVCVYQLFNTPRGGKFYFHLDKAFKCFLWRNANQTQLSKSAEEMKIPCSIYLYDDLHKTKRAKSHVKFKVSWTKLNHPCIDDQRFSQINGAAVCPDFKFLSNIHFLSYNVYMYF